MGAEGSGSSLVKVFALLDKVDRGVKAVGTFKAVKEKLTELTEYDSEITNKEWEKIQLLTPEDLPFEIDKYRFSEGLLGFDVASTTRCASEGE